MTNSSDIVLRTAVVDDEPLASALIAAYVRRTPFLELVAELNDAEEALALALAGKVDLLFLDIHMPRLDGISLASRLGGAAKVVFTTAYTDHALEGFGVNALHYLLKPISYSEFLEAAQRALPPAPQPQREEAPAAPAAPSPGFLTVKSEYRLLRIPLADIDYVEGLKDYVKIYTAGNPKPVLTIMSMKAAEEALNAANFMRVHRSFIVNLDHVRVVERNCILMGGRAIPISDNCRRRFAAALGI